MISSGISDVAIASVYSKKTRLKKVIMIIIYYEFIARNDGFWQAPDFDFRFETKARKVMVDFKFDALYR